MRAILAAASLVVLCVLAAPAHAQDPDRAVEFEDFGFTDPCDAGARAGALRAGGVLFGDVSTIIANNAGLARLKRIHGALVVDHESARVDLGYGATVPGSDVGATRLAFAGAAYPLRVLRGSFVPAVSVQRAFASDLDLAYARDNVADGRAENFRMQQDGATYAYALGLGTDLSSTLSAGVSAFFLDGHVDTYRRYDWQPLVTNPGEHTYVLEDVQADVGGYGAQVGLQLFFHRNVRIGLRFNAPTVVNVKAVRVREETRQIDNDVGTFVRETIESDSEYIVPHSFSGAIAVPLSSFLLTAQVDYTDWSEAAIGGKRLYTQAAETVFASVLGYRAGVEWSAARLPLRLRAGWEHTPAPLKFLQSDRIDNDSLERVTAQAGRTRLAAGAGVLLFERVVLDATWMRTSGSRETAVVNDAYRATLVALQGTYWF